MNSKNGHLAIIPARSGSKRLPGKNIMPLAGKPLIAWSITAALESELFDRVIFSTDSEEYAELAKKYGAEIPCLREKNLATDHATSVAVVLDVLKRVENSGISYDYTTLLQPTSPLRNADDIKAAWDIMKEKKATSVISVCKCEHPPEWCNVLPDDNSMKGFIKPEVLKSNYVNRTKYRINGAIYMIKTSTLKKNKSFFTDEAFALVMPQERSIDIDNEPDFILAESIINKKRKHKNGQSNY